MKYYIISRKKDDEFEIGTAATEAEAIEIARDEWNHMNLHDQRNNEITVRIYEEDIEDENCNNFDYDTVEWDRWYAVQEDAEDDWGYGSYDYDEAVKMLKSQGCGQIAVIRQAAGFCENEIPYDSVI